MLKRIKSWYAAQSDTTKAFVWIGVAAIAGIILRWDAVIEGIKHGFGYYAGK